MKGACGPVDFQLKPNLFKQYLKSIGMRLLTTVVDHSEPQTRNKPLYIYQKCWDWLRLDLIHF